MNLNDALLADWRDKALRLETEVRHAVVGQDHAIRLINIAVFARGHVLLEGDVGVGKTTLLRAVARAIGGAYERIEGTIDLMPNDLVYHTYISEEGKPRVEPGPLLKSGDALSVFFFNEINRARPQVQSLLLRAMAERSVSAFNSEHRFPHMLVFADRNRVEKEETFELSSAARDRFMLEIPMDTPAEREIQTALMFDPAFHDTDRLIERVAEAVVPYRELNDIAAAIQASVKASDALQHYALDLWHATRTPEKFGVSLSGVDMGRLVLSGASPRGTAMLMRAARVTAWLAGRDYLTPEDLQGVFRQTISHRVFFTPVYEMRRADLIEPLIAQILGHVAAP
ncbi:MAG: MoxR family ATPase [Rhodocyclaceae bacterium]|jgi:MoxR-like ATPase|nr:MAG: MoxR family ATPase [Rhodocyclaceae bacterium]